MFVHLLFASLRPFLTTTNSYFTILSFSFFPLLLLIFTFLIVFIQNLLHSHPLPSCNILSDFYLWPHFSKSEFPIELSLITHRIHFSTILSFALLPAFFILNSYSPIHWLSFCILLLSISRFWHFSHRIFSIISLTSSS